MKKQMFALALLATSLLVLPGCWKSSEEAPKKSEKVAFADDKVTKKPSKELIENDSLLDLDKELIEDIEA